MGRVHNDPDHKKNRTDKVSVYLTEANGAMGRLTRNECALFSGIDVA